MGITAITLWTAQAMIAEGRLTQEQLGNGAVTRRGYNPYTGRLNSIRSGVSAADAQYQNDSYDYDVLGNLESRSQLMSNGGAALNESFTYDALNRLNTSTIGGVTKTTTYDELGNLTSKTGVGLYRYPPSGAGSTAPNAVASVLGTVAGLANPGFSYEVNGNLKTGMGRRYAWTAYDMPSSIDKLDGTNAVQRTAFLYGPDHARTRQTISPVSGEVAGSPTTTIWYGGAIEKEIDTAANTTTIRTVLPAQLGFIEEKLSGTSVAPTADGTRNLRYFLTDHLGSTLAEMDQAQAVLQRMSYDAWGRRRNADGSDDTGPQWGSLKNAQDHSGYTGHEHLDQLGLVNMNARMYDPLLGRHTSADPTVPDPTNVQAFNRYSYVLNNALVFTDPTGLEAEHVNRTSDSICGGRPECAVYIAPSGEDATQTEGHHMGVAITEYLHATPLGQKDPAAASQLNSGAPPASQQESSTDPGPEIRRINRHFETALAAGDVATMQALYDKYVALKGDDPSSAPNVVRMGVAIMGAQARQGNYDLSSLAPMASAALGSGMLGAGLPGPNSGAGPTVSRITPGSLPSAAEAAALNTLKHIDAGTKPLGDLAKKWGTQFKNWAGDLPGGQGTASPYREYRVAPPAGTPGAGPNRIVVNGKTGEVYYTWTHYGDTAQPAFVKIR